MRPIDGDAMLAELRPITYEMEHSGVTIADMSNIMRNWVERQPTLTPPNEWVTLETVAEILAEQFCDECACNVNGNDEWLPMMCHYGDVCPDPPEHLGCWMELLRNKYRRPPERQEDT